MKCVFCKNSADFKCKRCYESYCSDQCQTADWEKHKFICFSMPELVEINGNITKNTLTDGTTNKSKCPRSYPDLHLQPLRLPHAFGNGLLGNSVQVHEDLNKKQNSIKDSIDSSFDRTKILPKLVNEIPPNLSPMFMRTRISTEDNNKKDSICSNELDDNNNSDKMCSSYNRFDARRFINTSKSEDKLLDNQAEQMPWKFSRKISNDFFDAIVHFVDAKNESVWVSDIDWIKDSFKFLSKINEEKSNFECINKADISSGELVIVPFEELFYRAEIIENLNQSNEVRVRLVDFGNHFYIPYNQCYKPIEIAQSTVKMSFAIKHTGDVQIGQTIKIKILNKDCKNVYTVEQKIEENEDNISEFKPFNITGNFVLTDLDNFDFIIYHRLDRNKLKALGVIVKKDESLVELSKSLMSDKKSYYNILDEEIPEYGYVTAQYEKNCWRRALLLGLYKNEYLVLFIDDGKIKIVDNVKRIPEDFKKIPCSTFCVEFKTIENVHEYLLRTQDLNVLTCKLGESGADQKLTYDVYVGEELLGNAILTMFDGNYGKFLGSDTYTYPFVSDEIVHISEVISYTAIEISLHQACLYYEKLFDEIATGLKICKTLDQLNAGDVVLFKHEKSNKYCRGKVISKSDRQLEVIHLESGEKISVVANNVKEATAFVKFCPKINRMVSLYLLNKLQVDYVPNKCIAANLKRYCSDRNTFVLAWQNYAAELFFDVGKTDSLNKKLETVLSPKALAKTIDENITCIAASTNIKNKIYKFTDITTVPLECGQNVTLLILDTSEIHNGYFTACIDDLDYHDKLTTVSQLNIINHCRRKDIEQEYSPIVGELCLTLFEGDEQWYRAFCLSVESSNTFKLVFFDYGNIQISTAKQIRKMVDDFLFPCYANTCILQGFQKQMSEERLENLIELLQPNSLVTVDKVEKQDDLEYSVLIKRLQDV